MRRRRTSGTCRCRRGCRGNSAVTVSYVGDAAARTRCRSIPYNEVPPGRYPNLQAAKPYPAFGEINVLENRGDAEYNGLQIKWERRFARRASRSPGPTRSRRTSSDTVATDETGRMQPFAPAGYLRGPLGQRPPAHALDQRGLRAADRARPALPERSLHPVADAILGGWQLSGINSFVSGAPLSISVPGATLGNGWGTRANVAGDPNVSDPVGRAVVQHGGVRARRRSSSTATLPSASSRGRRRTSSISG